MAANIFAQGLCIVGTQDQVLSFWQKLLGLSANIHLEGAKVYLIKEEIGRDDVRHGVALGPTAPGDQKKA